MTYTIENHPEAIDLIIDSYKNHPSIKKNHFGNRNEPFYVKQTTKY